MAMICIHSQNGSGSWQTKPTKNSTRTSKGTDLIVIANEEIELLSGKGHPQAY
jgi:hypothetical protein